MDLPTRLYSRWAFHPTNCFCLRSAFSSLALVKLRSVCQLKGKQSLTESQNTCACEYRQVIQFVCACLRPSVAKAFLVFAWLTALPSKCGLKQAHVRVSDGRDGCVRACGQSFGLAVGRDISIRLNLTMPFCIVLERRIAVLRHAHSRRV